jgi:hypothetical protein
MEPVTATGQNPFTCTPAHPFSLDRATPQNLSPAEQGPTWPLPVIFTTCPALTSFWAKKVAATAPISSKETLFIPDPSRFIL